MGADPYSRQRRKRQATRLLHGFVGNGVNALHRYGVVENIAEQFHNAAIGTVAKHEHGHDEPSQPTLGHRDREKHLVITRRGWGKGLLESLLGLVGLHIDELAADFVVRRHLHHRLRARESMHSQGLALRSIEELGGTGLARLLRRGEGRTGRLDAHVCFLHETRVREKTRVWGKQAI